VVFIFNSSVLLAKKAAPKNSGQPDLGGKLKENFFTNHVVKQAVPY
jgi:hypothetical protein